MSPTETNRRTRREQEQDRATWRDALPAAALFAAALAAMVAVGEGASTWAELAWAVPLVAASGLLVRLEVRGLRRADEFQRLLQLEALAIGFAAVVVLLGVAGVLVGSGVSDARPWLTISLTGGVVGWAGARAVLTWRSR